jgi:hypothetical protein
MIKLPKSINNIIMQDDHFIYLWGNGAWESLDPAPHP